MPRAFRSIRFRLALWYAALLGAILVVTSLLSYSFHSASHYDDVDRSLKGTAIHTSSQLKDSSGGYRLEEGVQLPLLKSSFHRTFGCGCTMPTESPFSSVNAPRISSPDRGSLPPCPGFPRVGVCGIGSSIP